MKGLFTVLVLSTVCFSTSAGLGAEQWAKSCGGSRSEWACTVQAAMGGGYFIAGSSSSFGAGENDLWLVKLDGKGAVAWQMTCGGSGNDYATCMQRTKDGGFIVVGTTHSFGAGSSDVWILKFDDKGGISWQKTYGTSGNEHAASIHQTTDGGYVVAANTSSFGAGESDLWIFRLDGEGRICWQKTYGGKRFDWAFGIRQTRDGGYVIAGDTFSFGKGKDDVWIVKLDFKADIEWQKTYGRTGFDWGRAIRQTRDGGYIVAGNTFSFGAGEDDVWILKLDAQGDISWQKTYGGSGFDWPCGVQETAKGGYIVAGGSCSFGAGADDVWVLELDGKGDISRQNTYGGTGSDYGVCIRQAVKGGYIIAGNTSSSGAGESDLWMLKVDRKGEIPNFNKTGSSEASVSDTSVVAQKSDCQVESTSVPVTDTTVSPQSSSAKTSY